MILVPNNYIPVQEVYYGKPKEFEYIEHELAKIIKMVDDIFDGESIDINNTQELKNIENAFTKYFKLKECNISFYSTGLGGGPNAYTLPTSFSCFKKDPNNKKLADPSKLYINVNVDISLIHSLQLTPEELMAIILHEMGHGFDASIFMLLSRISIVTYHNTRTNELVGGRIDILNTLTSVISGTYPMQKLSMMMNKSFSSMLSSVPGLQTIWNKVNHSVFTILHFMNIIMTPFSKMTSAGLILARWINPGNLLGYGSEKFADSFASSYGYGPDAASAFAKMEKGDVNAIYSATKKIPVLNIGVDALKTYCGILGFISSADPHPTNATRIKSQINKLKRDLKDPNLKPEIRKMIEDDISDIEEVIDTKLLDMKENAKHGEVASTIVNTFIIKACDGKIDPREFIQFLHKEL